ncbi:MAG: DUF4019 domain-containing protein [Desulfobacterales bacterium]|jgi:hypothetical protein
MVRKIAWLVVIGMMFSSMAVSASDSKKLASALFAANKWLALVDQDKYAESWKEAADLFRHTVQSDLWVASLKALREPLGKLISRKVKSAVYKTTLPGAPDGQYVVIEFTSSFKHKKTAVETVTPMLGKDGVWRVSGYFIK